MKSKILSIIILFAILSIIYILFPKNTFNVGTKTSDNTYNSVSENDEITGPIIISYMFEQKAIYTENGESDIRSEALSLIDAAHKFNLPIMETIKRKTISENKINVIEMSENELLSNILDNLDAMGFVKKDNQWFFDDKKVEMVTQKNTD